MTVPANPIGLFAQEYAGDKKSLSGWAGQGLGGL